MTSLAAFLGYAYAVYPIWHHVAEVRKTETLGGFLPQRAMLESTSNAYYPDAGIDADSFGDVVWRSPP